MTTSSMWFLYTPSNFSAGKPIAIRLSLMSEKKIVLEIVDLIGGDNLKAYKLTCEIKIESIFSETLSAFTDEPLYGVCHLHVADGICHTGMILSQLFHATCWSRFNLHSVCFLLIFLATFADLLHKYNFFNTFHSAVESKTK